FFEEIMNNIENLNNSLAGLMALLEKPIINSVWYNRKEVKLDGYKFVGCRFDGCTIVVTSANFELENCYIDDETVIKYGGDVVKTIKLYNCRNEYVIKNMPFFAPVKNDDGTITIKG
ncbi:hypothetical protein ACMU90_003460, partial [Vibrio cholerae]